MVRMGSPVRFRPRAPEIELLQGYVAEINRQINEINNKLPFKEVSDGQGKI